MPQWQASNGHYSKRVAIFETRSHGLSRVLDLALEPVELPESGLVLSEALANRLHLRRGDMVHAEFLGRNRLEIDIPVVDIIQSYIGLMAFMDVAALNRLFGESPSISGVHVLLDPTQNSAFFERVRRQPALSALALQRVSLAKFQETIAENIYTDRGLLWSCDNHCLWCCLKCLHPVCRTRKRTCKLRPRFHRIRGLSPPSSNLLCSPWPLFNRWAVDMALLSARRRISKRSLPIAVHHVALDIRIQCADRHSRGRISALGVRRRVSRLIS
jgi:hypothetical protein